MSSTKPSADVDAYLKKTFPVLTINKAIQQKEMFLGSYETRDLYEIKANIVNGKVIMSKGYIKYSMALMQTLKELMTNVSDQATRVKRDNLLKTFSYQLEEVNEMKVNYVSSNGAISVYNNGTGFLIEKHQLSEELKRDVYLPEFICTQGWSGSNHESADRITGGVNGLGIKLIAATSEVMNLITYGHSYNNKKIKYEQKFRNGGDTIELPKVTTLLDNTKESTVFAYIPRYVEQFKISNEETKRKEFLVNFEQHVFGYVCLMSAWFGSYKIVDKKDEKIKDDTHIPSVLNVSFNDTKIKIHNMNDIAHSFFHNLMESEPDNYKIYTEEIVVNRGIWEVTIVVHKPGESHNISLVNGLIIPSGDHFTKVKDTITSVVEAKIKAIFSKIEGIKHQVNNVNSCMSMFIRATVIKPSFEGQIKDKLVLPSEITNIPLSEKFTNKISDSIEEIFKKFILVNLLKTPLTSNKKKEKITYEQYTPAQYAGTTVPCDLFLTEGLSAAGMIRTGIPLIKKTFNKTLYTGFDICAIYSLGGVIPNVLKAVGVETIEGSDIVLYDIPDDIKTNIVLSQLMIVLGLEYNKKYTVDNISTLRYSRVISAVDWDLDGVGNILGLVVTWFYRFWPELLALGYLHVFRTPIVRAKPIDKYRSVYKLKEFTSEIEYREWRDTNNENHYEIFYYKGLARHEKDMINYMFTNFVNYLIKYTPDITFSKDIEIYYGKDSDGRKDKLTITYQPYSKEELDYINKTKCWKSTIHLEREVKAYQNDNLKRKLPNCIDGFVDVRRKIFMGLYQKFIHKSDTNSKPIKVFQASGLVAEKMHYHHGEGSLNKAIITMSQTYLGGRKVPLLRGIGNFGTRVGSTDGIGRDSGAPRYIDVKLNTPIAKVIFRQEDLHLLAYKYGDGGERIEPEFFVPVIPMAILESEVIPAHGWKQERHARKFLDTCDRVKTLINNYNKFTFNIELFDRITNYKASNIIGDDELDNFKPLPQVRSIDMDLEGFKCDVRYLEGVTFVVGKYTIKSDSVNTTITITELPPYVGAEHYRKQMNEKLNNMAEDIVLGKSRDKDKSKSKTKSKKIDNMFDIFNASHTDTINIVIKINTPLLTQLISDRNVARTEVKIFKPLNLSEIINLNNNNSFIDPIEDLFTLYIIIHNHLNLIKPYIQDLNNICVSGRPDLSTVKIDHEIEEDYKIDEDDDAIDLAKLPPPARNVVGNFISYEQVFIYWFIVRKRFYEERVKRQEKLLEMNILFHENILRYIDNKHLFPENISKKDRIKQLEEGNYTKFLSKSIGECKYKRAEQIESCCIENPDVKYSSKYKPYKYIFDITEEDKTKESIDQRKELLNNIKKELETLRSDNVPFIGANLWKKEVDEVIEAYKLGRSSGWLYRDSFEGIKME